MKHLNLFLLLLLASAVVSCSKTDAPTSPDTSSDSASQSAVLSDLANNVIVNDYTDIDTKVQTLYDDVTALKDPAGRTDANLAHSQQAWRDTRAAWESCEGFLLGPVESANIDPNIDTWPVAFARLDSVLASPMVFSPENIDALEQDLKGFHPIEYLLFGKDGLKQASQLTDRELDYMAALALDVKKKSSALITNWDPNVSSSYYFEFTKAGAGSTVYPTRKAAFMDIVQVMGDICDEVGGGKLLEPFEAKDPSLEESPFSKNSIIDFTHNIQGVQNIYNGTYGSRSGKGLSDLVRANNLSLDGEIKAKIATALASLQAITLPFGAAISTQPTQITNAMSAINDLHDELDTKLAPYLQQYTN